MVNHLDGRGSPLGVQHYVVSAQVLSLDCAYIFTGRALNCSVGAAQVPTIKGVAYLVDVLTADKLNSVGQYEGTGIRLHLCVAYETAAVPNVRNVKATFDKLYVEDNRVVFVGTYRVGTAVVVAGSGNFDIVNVVACVRSNNDSKRAVLIQVVTLVKLIKRVRSVGVRRVGGLKRYAEILPYNAVRVLYMYGVSLPYCVQGLSVTSYVVRAACESGIHCSVGTSKRPVKERITCTGGKIEAFGYVGRVVNAVEVFAVEVAYRRGNFRQVGNRYERLSVTVAVLRIQSYVIYNGRPLCVQFVIARGSTCDVSQSVS